jgi:undecaprenyl-diphosphatase
VFLALNGLHAPYFDVFMKLFTGKWIWVPMYAAVLFAVVRNYRLKQNFRCMDFSKSVKFAV